MNNRLLLSFTLVAVGLAAVLYIQLNPSDADRAQSALAPAGGNAPAEEQVLAQPQAKDPLTVLAPPANPWKDIQGARWDEIRRKNLEAGLDLDKHKPPVPWEEARVLLAGELAKLGDEQAKVNIELLTAFNGQFDRQWIEANQLEGFEITEESKADLLAIEEKHQAVMRPLAEQWVYEVDARLLQTWKSHDIDRAPYNLNYGDIDGRTPKSRTFYQRASCAGGWCARIALCSADCPEVRQLEEQLANLRGRKAAELASYARKHLKKN